MDGFFREAGKHVYICIVWYAEWKDLYVLYDSSVNVQHTNDQMDLCICI